MKRVLVLFLVVLMAFSLCTATVGAKEGDALDLAIGFSEGENGEVSVTVSVENVRETLHVSEFVVKYDSEKLELVNSVDEDGVLDCITNLPKDWENFVSVEKEGVINALALTAAMEGLKNGELKFEFKFRIKDGATGEAKIEIPDENVLGAYVGKENDIKEFGGKGGNVTVTLTEEGKPGDVSVDTVVPTEDPDGGNGWVLWTVIGAAVVVIAIVAVIVIKKKK